MKTDIDSVDLSKYSFSLACHAYANNIDGMSVDDDTNYTVLSQEIIETYGRNFKSLNVVQAWLKYQLKDAYCTAERVAFCNFVKGYQPPYSAVYKNPYREWIGARIRTDYYGYINLGNPELTADLSVWRSRRHLIPTATVRPWVPYSEWQTVLKAYPIIGLSPSIINLTLQFSEWVR